MITPKSADQADGFTPPGVIRLSPAALDYARRLMATAGSRQGRDWVATFDWAESISIRRGPNEPLEPVSPCVTLGAFERHQIPAGYTTVEDGVEYAIQIPSAVWSQCAERLIDIDDSLLFKLVLR